MIEISKCSKYYSIFSNMFLFNHVDEKIIRYAYSQCKCTCIQFQPGEKVYADSNLSKSMGIVIHGKLIAVRPNTNDSSVILNIFLTGGVFGLAKLFHHSEQNVSEIIAEKQSKVIFISENLLRELFQKAPLISENYITYLTNRICFLNSRISNFTAGSAQERLAFFLINILEQSNDRSKEVILPCNLTQLSEILNIGRASLYRAFDSFVEMGIIERKGKKIKLLEVKKLYSIKF